MNNSRRYIFKIYEQSDSKGVGPWEDMETISITYWYLSNIC
jgi:hypothetical protein